MSISSQWVTTKEILDNPKNYINKYLFLGDRHSLLSYENSPRELIQDDKHLFNGVNILERIHVYNSTHILIQVDNLKEFHKIQRNFHAEALKIPEIEDDNIVAIENYIITAILPDGSKSTFSRMIPI